MSFLSQFFGKRGSAPVARDRLQILLQHERAHGGPGNEGQSELIAKLREEILDVIARHVPIDRDKVQIKLDRGAAVSTLEIDIEVPELKKVASGSTATPTSAGKSADVKPVQPASGGPKSVDAKPSDLRTQIDADLERKAEPAGGQTGSSAKS